MAGTKNIKRYLELSKKGFLNLTEEENTEMQSIFHKLKDSGYFDKENRMQPKKARMIPKPDVLTNPFMSSFD